MEQASNQNRKQGIGREAYLLTVRNKQLQTLKDTLAAQEELSYLQSALLAMLTLSLLKGCTGVRKDESECEEALFIDKSAVKQTLDGYRAIVTDAGECYRITYETREEKGKIDVGDKGK